MTPKIIISGSRPTSFLMRRVWFNCNKFFSGFDFIFSNSRWARVLLFLLRHIDKIFSWVLCDN